MVDLSPAVAEAAEHVGGGRNASAVVADLTTTGGRETVEKAVSDRGGELAALVNNAGIIRDVRLAKMTDQDFRSVVVVNLGASYLLTLQMIPYLGEGSAIVSLSSRAYLGSFGQFNYGMSKGALVGMTRALARDLAPGVRCNAVAPGLTETAMTQSMPPDVKDMLVKSTPLQRAAQPSEIADLISFLCSDRSSFITGQVIVIEGGRSL
jgi:NAD(P)-dependent dehydrogenase (short-subunit alcohol dehydrogenase family)